MAKMNGCNDNMAKPSGMNSTRVNPAKLGRANLARNGVNQNLGGGAKDNYEKSGAKESRDPMMKGGRS